MGKKAKQKFYAYRLPDGKNGIVSDWVACEKLVSGKANARYRGFVSHEEAAIWLKGGAHYEPTQRKLALRTKLSPGIYFDAGTGRGIGVEVSVTDEKGVDLLRRVLPFKKINKFGKHPLGKTVTNNYGELLGCFYAMQVAKKLGVKKVFGDSRLVLNFWSRGVMKEKGLPKKTADLIRETADLREGFESSGGTLSYISGDVNPADLGFH
jgi:viroplasmin and RNaseH domain-containing protein